MVPKVNDSIQQNTVNDLLKRLLPNHFKWFNLIVDRNFIDNNNNDRFSIETKSNQIIQIKGTTGVAVANGIYYYLKNIANCSISWSGNQMNKFLNNNDNGIPIPLESIKITIRDKFRYYQNTCTSSYSNVWWQWSRWQKEIDWMALHGINLPLAFNGQEIVFRKTFLRFNMTIEEIDDYFSGPAFLAWNRMGNIQTWSGPLSEYWHQYQYQLQLKILERMRNFGMYPVIPGFAGHVSRYLKRHLENSANISRLTDWNQFGHQFS